MQYKQKNLWMSALMALLSITLLTAADCGKGKGKGGEEEESATKKVNVHTVAKVTKSADFINKDAIDSVFLSGDSNWAYFVVDNGADLHTVNIGGAGNFAKNIADKKNWTTLSYKATGLGGAAGKAELANATKVVMCSPGTDGALVSVTSATPADNGVVYFKGNQVTFAWGSDATNLGNITAGSPVVGYIVKQDAVEIPYVFDIAGVGTTHGKLEAQKLAFATNRTGHVFTAPPSLAYDSVHAYAVDKDGIAIQAKATLGTAADFSDVEPSTANVGSNGWWQDSNVPNAGVTNVVAVGGNLYIALASDGATDHTGGVAVYNTLTPGIKKPAAVWNKVGVVNLAVDGNKVWAVTPQGLIEVKINNADVGQGDRIDKASVAARAAKVDFNDPKDGYDGVDFPADKISGAIFVGGNMIVTTNDAGVYTVTANEKKVKK
jgi:hypothetical protein